MALTLKLKMKGEAKYVINLFQQFVIWAVKVANQNHLGQLFKLK